MGPENQGSVREKVLPRTICTPPPSPLRHLRPGIFHGQLSHLTVRWALGMKSEPPF